MTDLEPPNQSAREFREVAMFGLMKARTCSLDDEAKELRRLRYCGTCKILGSLYGQKTRFLLNHDTVFLGEVLSALGDGSGEPAQWDKAIVSRNCLSLPARDAAIPLSLSFAAAATVVLTEEKLRDHAADSEKLRWRLGQRFYSRSFHEASQWLQDREFPLDDVRSALASQGAREDLVRTGWHEGSLAASLEYLAEPTALATGLFFAHGARFAGRPEAADSLRSLGRTFGTLVYHLDALEDYDRDARSGEFNAYRALLGGAEALSAEDSVSIKQRIWSMGVEVCSLIEGLPIPAAQEEIFTSRMRTNLSARLGLSPKQAVCSCVSSLHGAKQPVADARRAAPAASWRESLALLLNLPFLVSIASTLVSPLRFSATGGPGGIPEAAGQAAQHAKKAGGGGSSGGGGCDCCDACDCGDCCGGCDC